MVNVQKRDPNGNWITHVTIPVSAAAAHSTAGYVGLGNGAPPAFLLVPGMWRLNAQVSSPNASGMSDWVQFTVAVYQDAIQQNRKRIPF